ncbi:MAG: putative phosphodiesterase [Pirellulaceae bacterium]|jgi:predicted phosphodiesterase
MPVSPRTFGRRKFVSTTAAMGTMTLLPQCLLGISESRQPLNFIIISDTHIGYKQQIGAEKQWEKTATELAGAKGDIVIHLGDIVDQGQEDQYPIYLQSRNRIGKPVHEIPGNHDPEDLFKEYIRPDIDTAMEHEWLRFLLVNNARRDSHDGFLSEKQIDWIDQQCQEAKKKHQFAFLCLHVPVHQNKHPDRGWYVKPENGQTKFYEVVKKHENRIVAIVHGHFHNGMRGWQDHGIEEVCLPSALYNLNRGLKEKGAPGYNPLEFRPGYTLVELSNGTLTFQYKPLAEDVKVKQLIDALKTQ